MGSGESDFEKEGFVQNLPEDDGRKEQLRDRVRLAVISIAESEAKNYNMEISPPVMACIADLTFKFTEQLAEDLELFAQHGGHKTVNTDDVILSAHRNEHLAALLRSFLHELKGKEIQTERKRKKTSKKEVKVILD